MLRLILGIVAGIVAAFAAVWAIDLIGHQIYPRGYIDVSSYESIGRFIKSLPAGALVFILLAWFGGALVGGLVAATVSQRRWTLWLIAILVAAVGVFNVIMIPHPLLLQVGAAVAPLLGALAAKALLDRRLPRGTTV